VKLTISRNDLADLMAKGGSSAERTSVIPILKHARLVARNRTLAVSTTNLEMQAESLGAANVEVEGETTVDADKLKTIVDRLPRGVEILIALEGADLIVKAGRSRSRLPTLPVSDMPSIEGNGKEVAASFAMSGADLDRLLARAITVASTEETRYYLNGAYLHVRDWENEARLCATATDGSALIAVAVDLPEGAASMPGVIVSTATVAAALRLFRGEESVRLTVSKLHIVFEGATTRLASKLIDGTYPDYQRVIPALSPNCVLLDKSSAGSAVALLETFATKDQGNKLEAAPAATGLALAAGNGGEGDGFATVDAEFEGDVSPFGLSSRYLKAMLATFRSESVRLSLAGHGAPIRFSADSEPDTIGVVMPMRVSGRLATEGQNDPTRTQA